MKRKSKGVNSRLKNGNTMASQPTLFEEKLTLPQLEQLLWKAADILRGAVEAPDYKHYILPLLFFKRLSDVHREEYEEKLKKYGDERIAKEKFHRFNIPDGCFWEDVRNVARDIGQKLNDSLAMLTRANPELEGVINRTDFNARDRLPEDRLIKLVEHFSRLKLGNKNVEPDVLGQAYEYLIKQFALAEARKGGEFYTPREVVRVLVNILAPHEGFEVYDPCCGSGGMLIVSHYYLVERGENPKNLFLYGQESQVFTWSIARMNVILHDLEANIAHGDTFADPRFLGEGGILYRFDLVLANPMWNQDGYRQLLEVDKFGRFAYGVPPNNSADWGWIQHMLASLKRNGKMGVVLDQGVLFRGGSEGEIRKQIVDQDLIECVVALPEKIFYNTGAPGCLLFLNKSKPSERKGKILFIYAGNGYEKLRNMKRLRNEDIQKMVHAHRQFETIPKYASVASLERVRENDYNLSVTRYVDVFEEDEQINVSSVWRQLKELETERATVDNKVKAHLKELGFDHG